jgi:manganese transport protein
VVLSFGIPFALVPLLCLTSHSEVMRGHANGRAMTIASFIVAGVITGLNLFAIVQQFFL